MNEPILSTAYWKRRLEQATELHHSIFRCPLETWQRIEAKHRRILADTIGRGESVLDAGCGYGRLLKLMPADWCGSYLGVDISPDFVALAKKDWPGFCFRVGDLRNLGDVGSFDMAVLISIRPMVKRNLGDEVWTQMERELRRVASKLLLLEYDADAGGGVE